MIRRKRSGFICKPIIWLKPGEPCPKGRNCPIYKQIGYCLCPHFKAFLEKELDKKFEKEVKRQIDLALGSVLGSFK